MAATVLQVCLLAVLSLSQCDVGFFNEYALDSYCDKSIWMKTNESAIKLKLTRKSSHTRNMNCGMYIKSGSWRGNETRLLVQFLDIDIDCSSRNYVQLSESNADAEAGRSYCGQTNTSAYATRKGQVYVKYTSDEYTQDNGFTLLISTFKTVSCKHNEFVCDNGRCLDVDLTHDGYDNCGDNSDEQFDDVPNNESLYWGICVFVGLFTFIFVAVIVTVVSVVCCYICRWRKTSGTVSKAGYKPVVLYHSGTQAVQVNPTQSAQPKLKGVQGAYPPGPTPYQSSVIPNVYTNVSGSAVFPPPQSAVPGWDTRPPVPPPYSEETDK